jgi:5-formyltetrahydrofolate cyclo-ligase
MNDPKNELRAQARDTRNRLQPTLDDAEAASRLFFDTLNPSLDTIVAAYWPKGKEFDVRIIIDDCLKQNIPVALPVIPKEGREMQFAQWQEGDPLITNSFNVPEPEGGAVVLPDIVIVPFLAFDRRGYRLGQGGGHYDATLAALRAHKEIIAVGVGYGEQAVLFNLPIEDHDQKLDMIITPQAVFDYR